MTTRRLLTVTSALTLAAVCTIGSAGMADAAPAHDLHLGPVAAAAPTASLRADEAPAPAPATHVAPLPRGWVETPISFETTLGTFYGTYTHPVSTKHAVPATLIIGGSGNGDRNGNSGDWMALNPLLEASRWLAADGQASLRYDKLGSGETGWGNRTADDITKITFEDFLTVNAQAFQTLTAQPGVDRHRMSLLGHSEGGLFAMLIAEGRTGSAGAVVRARHVATIEGLSTRMLTLIQRQVEGQVDDALAAGAITADEAAAYKAALARAIAAIRAGEPLPADLPADISVLFKGAEQYLRSEDVYDPADVAARLPKGTHLLASCSDADIQVSCSEVRRVTEAAMRARAQVQVSHLTDMDHMLKIDESRSWAHYNDDLPYSDRLERAVAEWAR